MLRTHRGAVTRDFKGDFMATSTVFLPHVLSPTVAEAMAMRKGLSVANRMGWTNVIMESDSIEAWWGNRQLFLWIVLI
jgi:hypothetical protein